MNNVNYTNKKHIKVRVSPTLPGCNSCSFQGVWSPACIAAAAERAPVVSAWLYALLVACWPARCLLGCLPLAHQDAPEQWTAYQAHVPDVHTMQPSMMLKAKYGVECKARDLCCTDCKSGIRKLQVYSLQNISFQTGHAHRVDGHRCWQATASWP